MRTVEVSGLSGAALDWAVATARGYKEILVFGRSRPSDRGWIEVRFNPERKAATARFDPTDDWNLAGPIIEQEKISLAAPSPIHEHWTAMMWHFNHKSDGPTALLALMRCYVTSKMGPQIEVPEVLCELSA